MRHDKTRVTIYDVAAQAGVAISTVSRVLNGSHDVSTRTQTRVRAAIATLAYRPDRTARALASKQGRALCLALPTFTTPFHSELLKGVRARLSGLDLDLMLCDLGSRTPQHTLRRFLERGGVDGLLLVGMPLTPDLAHDLRAMQAPVVLVGHAWPTFDAFCWDDAAGGRLAMTHLIELGHRRIGFIRARTESDLQAGRTLAYREALDAAALPFDARLVQEGTTEKHGGFSEEAGYEAMQALLATAPDLTAVFASSDVQAFGALAAARETGRRVPEDLSVIGYDDVKTSRYIGLTSVNQAMERVGAQATERLLRRLSGELTAPPEHLVVTPEVRVRTTTQPLAVPA